MRGFARLPDLIASQLSRTPRDGSAKAKGHHGAPKPASRSQTDAVGFAQFAMSLARGKAAGHHRDRGLILPVNSDGQEDYLRQTYIGKGQFLVRQDQWDVLGRLTRETDLNRETTTEGTSYARLLSLGARSDFVTAATAAYHAGGQPDASVLAGLEEALDDHPECWGVAVVVAQAHMDMGLASLGPRRPTSRPPCDGANCIHHFNRAAEILDPFSAIELGSALLAEARCDLLSGIPDAPDRVCDDFEDLIDLDPGNPRHLRNFGLRLLPRWFGSFEILDEMAHETAERVEDIWGDGGYTWVWFDVLRAVPEAADRLDIDRYVEGIKDILDRRGTQHVTNLMAAHAGVVMDPTSAPDDISATARRNRKKINDSFGAIVRERLHELHPGHWAEAQLSPFANLPAVEDLAEDGEAMARSLISRHFHQELEAGQIVTFAPGGVELRNPA
ncbi:hypothetical protein [Pseudooceanicola sp.]|uniref:hypothetical protein n=1 Tax=Pseudooceanicola sp. TaxID=1914328 RepID=UPI002625B612|nr:hypothetical protein [Pseudooceanicola sp.]MDF1855650.1 hypothetical protein [Pseudooceanicola sp.]